jgi:cytochrome c peroxidase
VATLVSKRKNLPSSLLGLGNRITQKNRVAFSLAIIMLLSVGAPLAVPEGSKQFMPRFQEFSDPDGAFANLNLGVPTDTNSNPFFQELGTNGRQCVTCHQPSDAFSITPPHIRERFEATAGTDPIFRPADGANCPNADVATKQARLEAYSLLLSRGLIRVGIAVPGNADYKVVRVDNRYGCNATDVISMYRRPLPTTNLPFLSAIMFDGRESTPATNTTKILFDNYPGSLEADLEHQTVDATIIHAQGDGTRPTADEQRQIVNFEMKLFTAQIEDRLAGSLHRDGARGGPRYLSTLPFFVSINSSVHFLLPTFEQPGGQMTPGDGQFTSNIFDTYEQWAQINNDDYDARNRARRSIARGGAALQFSAHSNYRRRRHQ